MRPLICIVALALLALSIIADAGQFKYFTCKGRVWCYNGDAVHRKDQVKKDVKRTVLAMSDGAANAQCLSQEAGAENRLTCESFTGSDALRCTEVPWRCKGSLRRWHRVAGSPDSMGSCPVDVSGATEDVVKLLMLKQCDCLGSGSYYCTETSEVSCKQEQ